MELPAAWLAHREPTGRWATWLERLPGLTRDLLAEWELTDDGGQRYGQAGLVLRVRTGDGAPAALKIGFPRAEAAHEHLALQHWHGSGAVRLLRADPARSAMLLERLHDADLSEVWDVEACEVVAGLYARLHVPSPPQLRSLAVAVAGWTERLVELPRSAPVPRRLVEQTVALGRALATDDATTGRMVHSDLHYGNVLSGDHGTWLAIAPKPLDGDPHYEVAPLLWHRWEELAGDVRGGVRRRFQATVDAAGLDEDRARDWVVVRMVVDLLRELERPAPDPDRLTRCVTVAKAVQD